MSDGGRTALGGYLWQAIAVLGLAAHPLIQTAPDEEAELAAIVNLVAQGGAITSEAFEQDALFELDAMGLKLGDERILVQFKYSKQDPPPSLSEEDLRQIADALEESAARATSAGKPITAYALITNRHVASAERAARRGGQEPRHAFEQMIGGTPFRIITRIKEDLWKSWLDRAGRRYGCMESEVRAGIHQLMGQLFEATQHGHNAPLRKETVIEALTGLRNPHSLEAVAINGRDEPKFERMVQGMGLVSGGAPIHSDAIESLAIRREKVDELSRQAQIHSIIAVTGLGGTGKTITVGQWLHELRGREQTVAVLRTGDVVNDAHYLAREALSWATDSQDGARGLEPLPKIIERLTRANDTANPPLLVLGLDGLDDARLQMFAPYLQTILSAFSDEGDRAADLREPPRATVVITCRQFEEIERYLPRRDVSGFGDGLMDQCGIVEIDDFSWNELLFAAASLPESMRGNVERAITIGQRTGSDSTFPSGSADFIEPTSNGSRMLIESKTPYPRLLGAITMLNTASTSAPIGLLRHPVLWRAFLTLGDLEQERLLLGEPEALTRLAQQYISRFCSKAAERIPNLRREYVMDALVPVAQACQANGRQIFDRNEFLAAARSSGVVDSPDHYRLYDEALSSGLIVREERSRWRWMHEFVRAYLAEHSSDDLPSNTPAPMTSEKPTEKGRYDAEG